MRFVDHVRIPRPLQLWIAYIQLASTMWRKSENVKWMKLRKMPEYNEDVRKTFVVQIYSHYFKILSAHT